MKDKTRKADKSFCALLIQRFCAARLTAPASEWVEDNVRLNEPKIKGPFSFTGREYLRQMVDAFGPATPDLQCATDFAGCCGTGIGKTIGGIAGMCYRIANDPMRALVVKPTSMGAAGAKSFSRTRLIPTIKATECLRKLIPTGVDRYDFASTQLQINGTVIDLTGSNSVGQLGENRCDVVWQDEMDKYPEQGETSREASVVILADERTKSVSNSRRYKFSTPTLSNMGIWDYFLKGDQRRYFVPCPHCNPIYENEKNNKIKTTTGGKATISQKIQDGYKNKQDGKEDRVNQENAGWIVLAWSKQFSVFQFRGDEAYIHWDDSARDADGGWDLDKVVKSAHLVCPHCAGKILDRHKPQMNKLGKWVATATGAPGFVSWHLPSLYSISQDCNFGQMAKKFLMAKKSLDGVKGFINSDLAEPDISQAVSVNKSGIVGKHIELTGEWLKIMSVDYHAVAPYFYAVVRAWNGTNASHGIEWKSFNNWYEMDELQEKHKVIKEAVIIDAGFAQAEVSRECCNLHMPSRCELGDVVQDAAPEVVGWQPAKSFGGKRYYRVTESDGSVAWQPLRKDKFIDPFVGTDLARTMRVPLLEFLEDIFEDMLENILNKKTGLIWTISPEMDNDEYHRHIANKIKKPFKKNPRDLRWQTRPGMDDHIRLCEVLNLVMAYRLQLISFDAIQVKEKKH